MYNHWNPKQLIVPLSLILVIFVSLFVLDSTRGVYNVQSQTLLKVYVTDLDGRPLNNAKVKIVGGNEYFVTDIKGYTESMPIKRKDVNGLNWFQVDVTVQCEHYINTVLFNCVIYDNANRVVQIRMYKLDSSFLPFVAYSEIPPDSYVYTLFEK